MLMLMCHGSVTEQGSDIVFNMLIIIIIIIIIWVLI